VCGSKKYPVPPTGFKAGFLMPEFTEPPPNVGRFFIGKNPMAISKVTAFSRMPADLLLKIQEAATENDRSFSAEARVLLRQALEARAANGSNGK
jgi:hypothetical protein